MKCFWSIYPPLFMEANMVSLIVGGTNNVFASVVPPGSQLGLDPSLIDFENKLRAHDYSSAFSILSKCFHLPSDCTKRLCRRVIHLQNRYEHFASSSLKPYLKVFFQGFWPDMSPHNCQLLDLIRHCLPEQSVLVTTSYHDADIIFYTCYQPPVFPSEAHHALRLLFLGENVRLITDFLIFPFLVIFLNTLAVMSICLFGCLSWIGLITLIIPIETHYH